MSPRVIAVLLATAALAGPFTAARAENPRINVQVFRPAGHEMDMFNTGVSTIPEHLRWSVSALLHFGKNPLVYVDTSTDPDRRHELIQDQLTLDVMGTVSLYQWVDIGLAIPVFFLNSGQADGFAAPDSPVSDPAFGDIRLSARGKIINRVVDSTGAEEDGFGLAWELRFGIPSGSANGFVSDGFVVTPWVLLDYRYQGFTAALNLGANIRGIGEEEALFLKVNHEFTWRVGARYEILPQQLEVIGEIYGASSDFKRNATYFEGVLGGRYIFSDAGVSITLGGGSGFVKGYGNTKFRLFAGFMYAPPFVKDQDGDGILDPVDKCVTEPEDKDQFEDEDGCPDPDNDQDGIEDPSDRCINDKEDKDGFEDEDGCPELDNDGDGVPDTTDKCPMKPEDKDGFEDEDGCPELDNDVDGIPDDKDQCPLKPETKNGFEDEDGCPDESKAKLDTVTKKIVIYDKVYFATNKAVIKPESFSLLRDVAAVLRANPQIKRVRVEGHTDDRGSNKRNLKLSQARAESVKDFLMQEGISPERLAAQGFGEDRPAVEGKTKEARDANRRVEFIIVD